MSVDRSLTPPPSSFDSHHFNTRTATDEEYVPCVFDLIGPSRDASRLPTKYIPPIFLEAEAVDSSVLIGHGASFSATLQKIPRGPATIEITTKLEGWSMTRIVAAPSRPEYVVYKTARVAFKDNGEPLQEHRRTLDSVLIEFHALTYPPLFHHANIIDFLGIAWGSNPFSPAHKLPVIVVEYAKHGTLADLFKENKLIPFQTKHLLALDIVRGISALHQAGLVHGDVKSENVLICATKDREHVAKIADFGFSIVEVTEFNEVWVGGTYPWRAPETRAPVPVEQLKLTDIYSLGLLLWIVCLDGKSPFDLIISRTTAQLATSEEIEILKSTDKLYELAKAKDWCMRWLQTKLNAHVKEQPYTSTSTPERLLKALDDHPELRERLTAQLYDGVCNSPFMQSLDKIFDYSVRSDPAARDLQAITERLESDFCRGDFYSM